MAYKKYSFLNNLNMSNSANDQNNNKGVSEDIIKLPKAATGVKIHIKAAIFPDLNPKIDCDVIHNNIDIKKWKIGEHRRTAHSSFPNKLVERPITQAIIGGLVK